MRVVAPILALVYCLSFLSGALLAEEKNKDEDEYPGIEDPFGPPLKYKPLSDVGQRPTPGVKFPRATMLGADIGAGLYTGGLGLSIETGAYFGIRGLYFINPSFALEASLHYSNQLDVLNSSFSGLVAEISTTLIPVTAAVRYYFGSPDISHFIAFANPYLVVGGGIYFRSQTVLSDNVAIIRPSDPNNRLGDANNTQFGALAGVGVEIPIVGERFYLGVDIRYHLVFFFDEDDDLTGLLQVGDRGGDYVTPVMTLTYNF